MNLYSIIKSAIVTEKVTFLNSNYSKYALYVSVDSNKLQIKKAIKNIFNVDVQSINVVRLKGKKKRFKGVIGNRIDRKKVYFSVKEGQSLDMSEGI